MVRGLVVAFAVVGLLGAAGPSLAAGKIECAVKKDGKETRKMVASRQACEQLGGEVVTARPKGQSQAD